MSLASFLTFLSFAALTMALALPLAAYLTKLFTGERNAGTILFGRIEYALSVLAGPMAAKQQTWQAYLASLLWFNILGGAALFALLLAQGHLPLNPQALPSVEPALAFNIAVAFVTNTDWQAYGGETTLSYFSQAAGLTVQNFLSAATGLAVAFAVVRGFTRKENPTLGNFYADVMRAVLYVLLPMAFIFALILIWQGVPQNFMPYVQSAPLEGGQQILAQGPVADQAAIKILGSNGGGFFGANSAHPYENPTALSNLLSMVGIMVLPMALVLAFGRMVGDRRQGWALFAAMAGLFVILFAAMAFLEHTPNPAFDALNLDFKPSPTNIGGNLEGKEARFGSFDSVLWSVATTATSNGTASSAFDSYMPLATIVPMFNLLIGEVIFGGVGCGLYGMLVYVLLTVFIAGLMVGRTPEYLGKKIEAREIKLAVLTMLIYPVCVLGLGALSLLTPEGAKSIAAYGPHGLTQTLYAYASAAANNGTAFAGFNGDTTYQNIMLGFAMLIGRFGVIAPVLAIAGSLAAKRTTPPTSGTFPTHGPMFVVMLICTIVMFGGLTYFPVLALGPVAEHLSLFADLAK